MWFSTDRHNKMQPEQKHRAWIILLYFFNLVFLLAVYFFNGMSGAPDLLSGLFLHSVGAQSDKYYVPLTPDGGTFAIWGFIYTWQALWVLYSLVLLCRRTEQGVAYLSPVVISSTMVLLYMLGNACNIAWLFLFDRDEIEAALGALAGLALNLVICLALSYRTVNAALPTLDSQARRLDVWLLRIFLHNGLAVYATWTCIATLLNLAFVIGYSSFPPISVNMAATVSLSVLSVEIAVFVVTDLCLLDRYSRYTVTPYLVVVVALSGSIAKNWQQGARNSIFTAVLLAAACICLLLKVALLLYRHFTRSQHTCALEPTLRSFKEGRQA